MVEDKNVYPSNFGGDPQAKPEEENPPVKPVSPQQEKINPPVEAVSPLKEIMPLVMNILSSMPELIGSANGYLKKLHAQSENDEHENNLAKEISSLKDWQNSQSVPLGKINTLVAEIQNLTSLVQELNTPKDDPIPEDIRQIKKDLHETLSIIVKIKENEAGILCSSDLEPVKDVINNLSETITGTQKAIEKLQSPDSPITTAVKETIVEHSVDTQEKITTLSVSLKELADKADALSNNCDTIRSEQKSDEILNSIGELLSTKTFHEIIERTIGNISGNIKDDIANSIDPVNRSLGILPTLSQKIEDAIRQPITCAEDLKASIKEGFDKQLEKFSNLVSDLSSTKEENKRLELENQVLRKQISDSAKELDEKVESLANMEKAKLGLDEYSRKQAEAYKELERKANDAKKELFERIDVLEKERDTLKTTKEQLERDARDIEEELSGRIVDLEGERDGLKTAKDQLNDELADSKRMLSELEAKLNAKSSASDSLRPIVDKYEKWQKDAAIYDNARQKLAACGLFRDIGLKYGMDPDTEEGLVSSMKRLGPRDFLDEMYAAATEEKKSSKEPITQAEKEAYHAVNQCYRDIWQVDFDVFRLPGKQDMLAEFQKCAFEKRESSDIAFPRDKFQFTREIYVPMVLTPSGEIWKQALVKGGNN